MSPAELASAAPLRRRDEKPDLTRPQIAWDVRCLTSAARAVVAADPSGRFGFAAALDAAVDGLTSRTRGVAPKVSARDVVVAALAEACAAHAAQLRGSGRGCQAAARTLERRVKSGQLAFDAAEAWDDTPAGGPLEVTLEELRAEGVDADKVAWAVIGFEAQRHVNLIWHVANKLTRHFPERTAADLFGWGWQGLRVALRGYEPERGFKFSTYACRRISGAIQDGVRAENPIPKRLTTFVRKVAKAEEALASELGRPARIEEVAERLARDEVRPNGKAAADMGALPALVDLSARIDQKLAELSIMPRLAHAASIEELTAMAGERGGEIPVLIDATDPAELAVASERRDAIAVALSQLPATDAEAVRLLLYEGLSVAEAREVTGATAQQLRRRCARAKEQLAVALADWR